jgi:Zn-dependent protease with chaperone function
LAFLSRRAQYLSFVTGWRLLTLVGAAETIVQGALVVWLSFWLTAFFLHLYAIKLIAIAGIGAALAVFYAVVHIFKRPVMSGEVEGELVDEAAAPALWARVRQLARRMKTEPPQHLIAGIDTNFFVTESPLSVGGKALKGRSLFVSLPLLRVLSRDEADAVLGHELAHFRGGDTASSAALGPKLVAYDHYCAMMHAGRVTLPVFYMLRMYRVIFEIALKRDSREREFKADRVAAKLVSPQGIVNSLIKVAAYARYRAQVEQELFEREQRHGGALGISAQVAAGLAPFARSPHFMDAMESAAVPHPFDSHPPMAERMANVGHIVDPDDYPAVVTRPTVDSWANDMPTAEAIEQRLWRVYEGHFAAVHEQSLAYRYLPETDEERAIVLKYFPPVAFALKGGERIEISYEGLQAPGTDGLLSWDDVTNLEYEDGIGGDVLKVVHPEKGLLGAKSTKIKLPGISKQRDVFKGELGRYWHRHRVMRGQA